ncbi:hypothetical protein H9L39_02328 [Fusarium oxysporum f. sp. albedinis]|nr:hypothetical protein H9L39_02328 [Fusarium oxysporum f. sp. albedinis]
MTGKRAPRASWSTSIPMKVPKTVCPHATGLLRLAPSSSPYISASLEIPELTYEILEASDRTGGRVKTHYFSDKADDYFDVGAMRFPEATHMQRFVQRGAQKLLADAVQPYCAALAQNFDQGFQRLMEVDRLSTSTYLREIMGYDFHTIQWMESMTSYAESSRLAKPRADTDRTLRATGLFDQAFSETVLDALDFDYSETTPWWRIEGGGAVLISRMCEAISQPFKLNKAVLRIAQDNTSREAKTMNMLVQVEGEASTRRYDTVFVTTTLPALQRMDLRAAGLHPAQRQAINCLHYDSAAKVAIRFSHPWWRGPDGLIYQGGEAHTDLPLRVCVYPSCDSVTEAPDQPAVLLCSYTWALDAQRMASLISGESPLGEGRLVDLLLRNLAELHVDAGVTYDSLRAAYLDHYAFAWDRDPHAGGAFAFFGPGQFSNLYPFLTRPAADGNLHIAGEAASPVHGWVEGSLESAYRAVQQFLEQYSLYHAMDRLESQWSWAGDTRAGDRRISQLQVHLAQVRGWWQHGVNITVAICLTNFAVDYEYGSNWQLIKYNN